MCKNTKQSDKVFNVIADGVATWVVWYAFNIPCISSMKISKSILLQVRILHRNNLFATERLRWWKKRMHAARFSTTSWINITWSYGQKAAAHLAKYFDRFILYSLISTADWPTDRPTTFMLIVSYMRVAFK